MKKVALVTGCSSGIGLYITNHLLSTGWSVIGMSRRHPDCVEFSEYFTHIAVDLAETQALTQALAKIDKVDAIVHAAGLLRVGTYDQMSLEDGAMMWQIHLNAAAAIVQGLAPCMDNGGRIVLIGSRVASGAAAKSLYAASKSAFVGFSRSIAAELAKRAITVNVVSPAATDTPMLHDSNREGSAPVLPPFGRYVKPEEIAGTVGFLLSDAAASITGQQIVVCAGSSL
ncbi:MULTISPECIES: SDR family NAD(P)-dependent oxidoreductase [Marinomonas]|uniref:SDR family oxidoreductase n=1 Tax=Marinomonas rhodophyticola TaxID=2992803 RepID=A0ABT3KBE9_9GAMM|nr:SDR family oxidoreductase [Marinomonas sp. KJ51-3]MCW4627861.1 SDR family oxidoreductase [Marinomonas sp. KJ51-3]